ncbi:MAG: hypothetical protein ACFB0E_05040 [Leptolyngbyaceae cyanobacterium]
MGLGALALRELWQRIAALDRADQPERAPILRLQDAKNASVLQR